jgi:hypothetical protein
VLESRALQYALLDGEDDFAMYALLLLPDFRVPSPSLASRLETYVRSGGALLIVPSFQADASATFSGNLFDSVLSNRVVCFSQPLFAFYGRCGAPEARKQIESAFKRLLPDPLLRHDGPGTLRVSVMAQPENNRWIIHLLHYIPRSDADGREIVEDVFPLYGVKLSLRTPRPVTSMALRPQHHDPLEFWETGGRVECVVPKITGHQMIAVEFMA